MATMNRAQTWIVGIGAALVLLLAVIVPWNETLRNQHFTRTRPLGYHPIFDPPTVEQGPRGVEVNWPMVLVPMGAILVAAIAGFVIAGSLQAPAAPVRPAARESDAPARCPAPAAAPNPEGFAPGQPPRTRDR